MKKCSKCGDPKKATEFSKNVKRKDGRSGVCKECNKTYKKNYYAKNKAACIEKVRRRREEFAAWMLDFKRKLSCGRCGQDHPATLDFHHNDPDQKEFVVSDMADFSKEKIIREIEKCDVLCANCHRIVHFEMKAQK